MRAWHEPVLAVIPMPGRVAGPCWRIDPVTGERSEFTRDHPPARAQRPAHLLRSAQTGSVARGLRLWTPREDAILRARYGCEPLMTLAGTLDRTPGAVQKRACVLGVKRGY